MKIEAKEGTTGYLSCFCFDKIDLDDDDDDNEIRMKLTWVSAWASAARSRIRREFRPTQGNLAARLSSSCLPPTSILQILSQHILTTPPSPLLS